MKLIIYKLKSFIVIVVQLFVIWIYSNSVFYADMGSQIAIKLQIIASIATALLEILFLCGIILGFPSLQLIFENEGYFAYLCPNKSDNISFNFKLNLTNRKIFCDEQEASFNLAFTIGMAFFYICSFPSGYLLDRFGTWIFRTIATSLYSFGFILLAMSSQETSYLLYPALVLLSGAGRGMFLTNFQLSNFSKSYRGIILTLMTGSMTSSVLTFLLVKKSYDAGGNVHMVLWITTGFTTLLWLRTYFLMPKNILHYPVPESEYLYGWNQISCCKTRKLSPVNVKETFPQLGVKETGVIQNKKNEKITFKECLKNLMFYTNMLFFSFISLRVTSFLASSLSWLRSFKNEEEVSSLSDNFGVVALFSGFLSPLNGIIIDATAKYLQTKVSNEKTRNLRACLVSMIVSNVLAIALSVAALVTSAYGSFVLYMTSRAFIHGSNTTFLGINFLSYHFGKLYGLTNLINGLFSLMQYFLF